MNSIINIVFILLWFSLGRLYNTYPLSVMCIIVAAIAVHVGFVIGKIVDK